jgi:hypothetical protein
MELLYEGQSEEAQSRGSQKLEAQGGKLKARRLESGEARRLGS